MISPGKHNMLYSSWEYRSVGFNRLWISPLFFSNNRHYVDFTVIFRFVFVSKFYIAYSISSATFPLVPEVAGSMHIV